MDLSMKGLERVQRSHKHTFLSGGACLKRLHTQHFRKRRRPEFLERLGLPGLIHATVKGLMGSDSINDVNNVMCK